MKAFNEKCDKILLFLKDKEEMSWDNFILETEIQKNDGIISYLKKTRGFLNYTAKKIHITQEGKDFILKTSFVGQRDNSVHSI